MRCLSLFTGAGGGLLGENLLGWKHIGYVEYDNYCQQVIAQRIEDGYLDRAPIFGDIRAFIDQGYAASYTGLVDVITAGFPCQPFSVAGKQQGEDDERNMWPETLQCISIIRPRYAFLENVPGLLAHEYFGRILGDLAESRYDVKYRILSAAEMGAPHKRDRLWILCTDTTSAGTPGEAKKRFSPNTDQMVERLEQRWYSNPDAVRFGRQRRTLYECDPWKAGQREFEGLVRRTIQSLVPAGKHGRVADGVANRVGKLRALGNGQVPAVARAAWELLNEPH